jgi:hypothetical protein
LDIERLTQNSIQLFRTASANMSGLMAIGQRYRDEGAEAEAEAEAEGEGEAAA